MSAVQPSDRASLEQALREAEAQVHLLFEAHPLPLWIHDLETLQLLDVNEAALQQYGYTRDELLGMTIRDLLLPDEVSRLPDTVGAASGGWDRAGVRRHRRKDGTLFEVEVTSHELRYGARSAELVVAVDVSERFRLERERRRSQQALADSEVTLRTIVDSAVFGMYRSTPEGRFTMANKTLADMLGYDSVEELIAVDIPRDVYEDATVRARLIADHGPIDVLDSREVQWKRKDGVPIAVRLSGHVERDERAAVVAYEMFVEDATERHTLEEQLRQAQKLEAIGMLAGGLAHDFNNLLTTILVTAETLLADRPGDAALGQELGQVLKATRRGAELIRQLMVFSRQQRLAMQTVELSTLVKEGAGMLRRLVRENVEIRLALEPTGTTVRADPAAVQQMLMNLVTNARDAMPGGGSVLIQTLCHTLDSAYCAAHGNIVAPGPFVVLAVSDTGAGMDVETLEHVFEPFFTTKPVGEGTGLGLATVYGLAKQHRGLANAYSEPGYGTSIKVYFPAVAGLAPRPVAAAATPVRGAGELILLAEDEDSLRHTARRVLEKHGYRVVVAKDGAEALERYRMHAGHVDLILTDVVMPRLSGPQFVAQLRAGGCRVPVLFTSGYTARDIEQTGPFDSRETLLMKPWTVADLTGCVRTMLDRAK